MNIYYYDKQYEDNEEYRKIKKQLDMALDLHAVLEDDFITPQSYWMEDGKLYIRWAENEKVKDIVTCYWKDENLYINAEVVSYD